MRNLILAVLVLVAGCARFEMTSFKKLSYPMPVSHVRVDGIDVAISDVGVGPRTLVLIHGLASYMPVWQRNLDELSRGHRVVAIDLPGYGKSAKGNFKYSMAFYARVVERVIETLGLQHVTLVGHSMGGQIALTHALRYPGKAEALVLVAPAGFERFGSGEGSWLAEAVDKDFVARTAPETVYANVAINFWKMPPEARFMINDRLRVIGGPDFDDFTYAVSRSVYAMVHEPVLDHLTEIRVPALVVFGTDDGLIPNPLLHGGSTRDVAEGGTRLLPHGRLVMIPRAGHMVQFERPAEFDAAVLDFLKEAP
ncbi:MAG: Pimeloyl-ACP methyl ester carboxylesterase [Myxococcales bacterium]|nr:Pimeloyl-ACP methyl ester carboxylesterase [Myxococcales bacterium]